MAFRDKLMKLPVATTARAKPAPPEAGTPTATQVLAAAAAAGAAQLGAVLGPTAVVCLGLYVSSIESHGGRPVQRASCTCDCWDARFKGRHGHSRAEYKNLYFNVQPAAALLLLWTAFWFKLLGGALKRILALARSGGGLRLSALAAGAFQFYPLFYGAWAAWNYINEEWPLMLWSQLFFLATELLPTYCLHLLLDKQRDATPAMCSVSVAVAAAHVVLALKERVLWGLVWPAVYTTNARDVMLVAGDVAVLAFFSRGLAPDPRAAAPTEARRHVLAAAGGAAGLIVCYLLLFSYRLD